VIKGVLVFAGNFKVHVGKPMFNKLSYLMQIKNRVIRMQIKTRVIRTRGMQVKIGTQLTSNALHVAN